MENSLFDELLPEQSASTRPLSGPQVRHHLRTALRSDLFQPTLLKSTALELVQLSRDPDVSPVRVKELVEREPVLAAEVLSVARSALYSRGNPIDSLDEALVRLGTSGVTGLFMTAALRSAALSSDIYAPQMEQLRRHMVATAHIARGLCVIIQRPADRAFLCGLLHDVGMAGSLSLIAELPLGQRPEDHDAICAAVSEVHEEASSIMGLRWNLPWATQWVVAHHHSFLVDGRVSPLAALINAACYLASLHGAPSLEQPDEEVSHRALHYFQLTGLVEQRLHTSSARIVEMLD